MQKIQLGTDFSFGCLRSLRELDADNMLEWMRDPDIAGRFQFDFFSMDRDRAIKFIKDSWSNNSSLHFAFVAETDEYYGTVSLKNVDPVNMSAEYAISSRKKSHGTGAARKATEDVLRYAFDVLGLERVYLDVRADNHRAIRFYEKIGFTREGTFRSALSIKDGFIDLVWFSMIRTDER